MSLKELYKTDVVTCERDASIQEAARMMKEHGVGDVIVVEKRNGVEKPVGVVTDRDIVLGAVCDNLESIESMTVADLMSPDVVIIDENMSFFEALDLFRENGVSRAPIVDEEGELCGVLSSSRLFKVISGAMGKFSEISENRKEFPEQAKHSSSESSRPQSESFAH